ncbi:MAG: chromosomal replication initiator protein DnaA [Bacteroidales bacterium]|jgi:chromosomal replication initiator protein|nr:chromosomal replication initiator protein DnaA [Bacteroidales bacterium]
MNEVHEAVWERCLSVIRDNVSEVIYNTWFKPIVPLALKNQELTIQVPSRFFYEYLEEQFIDLLKRTLRREIGNDARLQYRVMISESSSITEPESNRKHENPPVPVFPHLNGAGKSIPSPFVGPGLPGAFQIPSQLNEDNTFANFVEGECNRLARSAGFAVAQNPGGTAFNPLMIFGGSGLGKTHLVQAIGNEVKERFPNKIVLYVSANKFHTQFTDAVRNNTRNDFVQFYQLMDVLIMDDVQEFAAKPKTQETFFHIFNHLHQNGKQIILTSDKPAFDLKEMEQRLLSRFKWGLTADLQAPDFRTRMEILKLKSANMGMTVSEEVLEYIASHISDNVRELEGALVSLSAQSTLNKKDITLDLACEMINKFIKNSQRELSIDYISKVVCDYYKLPLDTLQDNTRKREIVQARQVAMYFSKHYTKSSLATIGLQIGRRDHATVLHALKTVGNLIDTDKKFKACVEDIDQKLKM